MSLLLDALKRAEQEKLARGERPDLQIVAPHESGQAQTSAPLPGQRDRDAAAASAAHRASLELQPLSAAPGSAAGAAPRPASPAASPAAAQAVFQAKLPPGATQERPRRGWMIVAGVILIAVLGAAAYVWYAMQQLAPSATPARRMAGPLAAPPSAAVAASPRASQGGFSPSAVPPPSTAPSTAPAAVTPAATPPKASPAMPAPEPPAAELLRQSPPRREVPPVRLDRAPEGPRIPPQVATGYAALRNSDFAGARRAYEAAINADSTNVDAHLGIATVEARTGNIAAAGNAYRRVLELDPRNPTALAGLATLADPSRRGTVEERLREDVLRYPQSPALHSALGNVYSSQKRWSEAQGEFFEAHRLDPGNADIAHNLAVALDNLGQPRLAAQFYRRALEAARTSPGQFDPAPVERRLAELGD